ncbi:MAG: hypothetical protein IT440_01530 [Phycisphaeraceae bacterium]|nr:hypothetical protein [Phycisphaeraceae bacterium]
MATTIVKQGTGTSNHASLPGLPRRPLDSAGQAEALQRLAAQNEQRIRLGVQLFRAAEAQTQEHRRLVEQIHVEHNKLREQVTHDVAKSLAAYDQWVGKIDENFTTALKQIETKIEHLQANWVSTQERIEQMLKQSEAMLSQSRQMTQQAMRQAAQSAAKQTAPAQASTAAQIPAPAAKPEIVVRHEPTIPAAKPLPQPKPVDTTKPDPWAEPVSDTWEEAAAPQAAPTDVPAAPGAPGATEADEDDRHVYTRLMEQLQQRTVA